MKNPLSYAARMENTMSSPRSFESRWHQTRALTICVSVFLAVWTAVVYAPVLLENSALTGSGAWYATGWIASTAVAFVAWAVVFRIRSAF